MKTETLKLTCNYIDVCSPDYLTDHHWRENECLIYCPIWEGMRTEDIVTEMWDCLNSGPNDIFRAFSETEIKESIRYKFDDCVSRDFGLRLMNFGIEPDSEDEDEVSDVYLYAYLSW